MANVSTRYNKQFTVNAMRSEHEWKKKAREI